MTKDTADLSQFHAVACREYTLPREEEAQPKRMDPREHQNWARLEVATSYLHGKYGVVIRIWEQRNRNSRRSARRICVKTGCERFCMPIKGQSKTTKKRTCRLFHKNYTYWEKELD